MTAKRQPREAEPSYKVAEAAAIKSVSPDTIRKAMHATEGPFLRFRRIGHSVRIDASDLDAWWDSLGYG